MIIAFTPHGWDDYVYWQNNDAQVMEKINELLKAIVRDPFKGIAKPESLRGNLAGYWSRRISGEHRLVYRVTGSGADKMLIIIQARFHY